LKKKKSICKIYHLDKLEKMDLLVKLKPYPLDSDEFIMTKELYNKFFETIAKPHGRTIIKEIFEWKGSPMHIKKYEYSGGVLKLTLRVGKLPEYSSHEEPTVESWRSEIADYIDMGPDTWMEGDIRILTKPVEVELGLQLLSVDPIIPPGRKSPIESATLFKKGFTKPGIDGKLWRIHQDAKKVKRWVRVAA
jgi:hypothetical protein